MKKFAFLAATVAVALFATSARATFELRISNPEAGATVTILDGGVGDLNPLTGAITFAGTVGNFTFQVTSSATKPVLGSAGSPEMDLHVFIAAPVGGVGVQTLVISASDIGFQPIVPGWHVNYTANDSSLANALISTSVTAYAASSNLNFDTSGVNTGAIAGFPGSGGAASFLAGGTTAPYSLTVVDTIKTNPGLLFISDDALLTPLPEPASIAMLVAGVPVLGLLWARRRKAKVA